MIHVFIVNPKVCKRGYSRQLKAQLKQIPELKYYVLSTKQGSNEAELVKMICHFFDNEAIRFYVCGGSGTLKNVLDGFEDMSRAEVAMIPFGTNDFLKNFDYEYSEFRDIESMINGNVVHVDYLETNVGRAINTVSMGVDSKYAVAYQNLEGLSVFGKNVPYFPAIIYAAFVSGNSVFDIKVEEDYYHEQKVTEFFFGSGAYIGGSMKLGLDSNISDGVANFFIATGKIALGRIPLIKAIYSHSNEELAKQGAVGHAQYINVRRANGSMFYVNLDGEIAQVTELDARIVHQGLRFVLPRRENFYE